MVSLHVLVLQVTVRFAPRYTSSFTDISKIAVPCNDGRCCQAGQDCVPGGCCDSGLVRCGLSKCYNARTSECCTLPGSAWACDKGASCCGTPGLCYKSGVSKCCADGKRTCSVNEDCVDGGCCPAGEIPCGQSKCYNPKTQKCCLRSGRVWGCPVDASCCDSPGVCIYPQTDKCCQNGRCPLSSTCCEKECCRSGALCGADGFCRWPMTTTSSASTTASRSQTPSSTTSKAKEPEEPEEPDEPEEPEQPISTPTPTPSATPEAACELNPRELSARNRLPNGRWGPKYCKIECDEKTRQKVYVWEIRSKVGETDQLVMSMCAGR